MLEEIRIRGLGVIEDAVLELSSGLIVLTGETGAGKTMVLTGLGLLLGGRADSGLVRPGSARAVVEGRMLVDPRGAAARRALDAGADLDDGVLLVSRTVTAEGRSRAHLGGRAVPAGVLAELAGELVAVHGQSDQHRLLNPARQRASLDRYAGAAVGRPLRRYADAYARLRTVEAELAEITTQARRRAQEADLLRYGIREIEAVGPIPGEEAGLAAEAGRLAHADLLRSAAEAAHAALLGDPAQPEPADAVARVGESRRELDRVRLHDPALGALADRLAEVSYLLADVASDIGSYAAGVETDPARLAAVEERRAAITGLIRKYGDLENTAAEVLAWAQRAVARLAELDTDDERTGVLRAEREALRAELSRLAAEVSAARGAAADRFGEAVTAEAGQLAMPHARVTVEVTQSEVAGGGLEVGGRRLAFGPTGVDTVEILLAPHSGAPARAIQRGASGGELSRVMLAVEVVFAGADPVPAFVFDEVDAGVGGKAAVEVGRRLAALARTAQVLVVTHLPQVAAFADQHLVVVKSEDGSVTRTGVTVLDGSGRVRELSRMLAGLEGSELARAHAEELLATAATVKGAPQEKRAVGGGSASWQD